MSPTVSVIMPVYNDASFLREAVDSALEQTHPPLEVIVVDDGSTDNSASIAESYGSPVRVIRQENQGAARARNRAIEVAQGDWLAFLDSDDLWKPEKLRKQLAAVEPDVVLVHTNWLHFGAEQFVRDVSDIPEDRRYTIEQLLTSTNPFHFSSVMVRRSLPVRFRTWAPPSEDMVFCLELTTFGRFLLVPEVLTEKRIHPKALTSATDAYAKYHAIRQEWLRRNELNLDPATIQRLREQTLANLVEVAWARYWRRDWESFRALRKYLRQYADDPEVKTLLARRIYPRWCYRIKDLFDAASKR